MGEKIAPVLVVIDTNVLISVLLFGGKLGSLRDYWRTRRIVPLVSKETFGELRRVLAYPKFRLTPAEISAIIEIEILPWFEVVEVMEKIAGICRDPHDDMFFAVAVNGGAAFLITGDNDLLVLKSFRSAIIVTPADFMKQIGANGK